MQKIVTPKIDTLDTRKKFIPLNVTRYQNENFSPVISFQMLYAKEMTHVSNVLSEVVLYRTYYRIL